MLSVVMLNVTYKASMLSVVALSVIMQSVVGPASGFDTCNRFQTSLICLNEVRRVGLLLTQLKWTELKKLATNKQSSLLFSIINDSEERLIT